MSVELPMCLLDWINKDNLVVHPLFCNLSEGYWIGLYNNPSEGAMQLLKKNPDKILWRELSRNPFEGAVQLLEQNPDKISWYFLSANPSKCAMRLLENNQDKINWYQLSCNKSEHAMQLLEKNPDKIDWKIWINLSLNSHIFKYDYKQMKQNCMLFKEDLMKNRFHPRNIPKFKDWMINGFDFE